MRGEESHSRMTDRPDDARERAAGDEPEPIAEEPATDEVAADGAVEPEEAVEGAVDDAGPFDDAEDEDALAVEADEVDEVDEADEVDEVAAGAAPAPVTTRERGRRGGRVLRRSQPARAPTASEIAVHVDDRISAAYVIVTVAVFVGLILYALLFGKGGALTPVPTAAPIPSVSASPSASVAPSGSPAASGAVSPSIAPSPSASPAASPS